mgnify:CR=1 FL=1
MAHEPAPSAVSEEDLDEHGKMLVPWGDKGTARNEPALPSCDKLGEVCKEVPPEWRDLCRACATERRTTSAQHDESDRRIVLKAAHALCRINAANVSYGQGDGHD